MVLKTDLDWFGVKLDPGTNLNVIKHMTFENIYLSAQRPWPCRTREQNTR